MHSQSPRYFSVKLGWVIDLSVTQSLKGVRGGPGVPIVTLIFLLKEKTPKNKSHSAAGSLTQETSLCPEPFLPSRLIIHLLYQGMCAVSSLRQCPVTSVVCVLTLFATCGGGGGKFSG